MDDYRLHACIRVLLIREWVDLTQLEYGVANGVVYLTGTLRHHLSMSNDNGNELALAGRLEAEAQTIPGVRDVVFQLKNLVKEGPEWKHR